MSDKSCVFKVNPAYVDVIKKLGSTEMIFKMKNKKYRFLFEE